MKENCEFQYYFNTTNMKPAVLDEGHEIVLANWQDNKHVISNQTWLCILMLIQSLCIILTV